MKRVQMSICKLYYTKACALGIISFRKGQIYEEEQTKQRHLTFSSSNQSSFSSFSFLNLVFVLAAKNKRISVMSYFICKCHTKTTFFYTVRLSSQFNKICPLKCTLFFLTVCPSPLSTDPIINKDCLWATCHHFTMLKQLITTITACLT